MKNEINEILEEHKEILKLLNNENYTLVIEKIIEAVLTCLKANKKILIAGNGGSASDAQHFAGEIVGRFLLERKGMPAISLSTDTSVLTCIGNDYGFESIFSRQVEALGEEGDVLFGISTSGNSKNIIKAIEEAKRKGVITIGLLGRDGGLLKEMCDISLVIPFDKTARVQEVHIITIHTICKIVEERMFLNEKK